MSVKGLENVIRNLNSLDRNMVPRATIWATNRVAKTAASAAAKKVAKETVAGDNHVVGIPLKLVRQRIKIFNATTKPGKTRTRIKVNRGNLPAIKLGAAQVRPAGKRGKLTRRGSVLKVGKYLFNDAFLQQLKNGRWQVMKRVAGKSRYPIDVVKIPLAAPLTQAFIEQRDRMLEVEMPKQLGYAIKQQMRLYFRR